MGTWEEDKKRLKKGIKDPFKRADPAIQSTTFNRDPKDEAKHAFVEQGGEPGQWLSKAQWEQSQGTVGKVGSTTQGTIWSDPKVLETQGAMALSQSLKDPELNKIYDIAKLRSEGKTDKQIMDAIEADRQQKLTTSGTGGTDTTVGTDTTQPMEQDGFSPEKSSFAISHMQRQTDLFNQNEARKSAELTTRGLNPYGVEAVTSWLASSIGKLPPQVRSLIKFIPSPSADIEIDLKNVDSNIAGNLENFEKYGIGNKYDLENQMREMDIYIAAIDSISKHEGKWDVAYFIDYGLTLHTIANDWRIKRAAYQVRLDRINQGQQLAQQSAEIRR